MTNNSFRTGQRYQVGEAFEGHVVILWKGPVARKECKKLLPLGLQFVLSADPPAIAVSVAATPAPYRQWEQVLVDEKDRTDLDYDCYYVFIPFDLVGRHCSRVA